MNYSVHQYLLRNGPSLSSEITEYLIHSCGLSSQTARQRVSRATQDILRLELSFPRRAKFLFLKEQAGTGLYWGRLNEALLSCNSAYGYAISAIEERGGIIPKCYFEIICGAPIKQKKHLSASTVLNRLFSTNLLKEVTVDSIGSCVYLGLHSNHVQSLIPHMKARILAEDLFLRGITSWLKNLGFVSYNQVKTRSNESNPVVSTTAWDLAAPSYLSPLVSGESQGGTIKPGFVVCDILLNNEVSERGIQPFLQKLNSLRSLKNVGKQLCFFFASSYSESAFNKLKSVGVSPATISSVFDKEVNSGMKELIELLSQVSRVSVSSEKLDVIFKTLGKVEGAASRLRGALFEYVVAEAMRASGYNGVEINKFCRNASGVQKEADVVCFNNKDVCFIEGKGYNINKQVTRDDVDYWLIEQVPVFHEYCLSHPDWKNKKLIFEFWTSSTFSDEALARLEEAKKATKRYTINFKNNKDLFLFIADSNNQALLKTYKDHFVNYPMTL